MHSKSFGAFVAGYMKITTLIGVVIGVLLFIYSQVLADIPVVIGTTVYNGITASLFLLICSPIILVIIGFFVSIFAYSASKR